MTDTLLLGAELRSGGFRRARGTALATAGGRIAAVGAARDLLARRARGTRVIRLPGGCLLPGFVDPHLHFRALARRRRSLDCAAVSDARALLARLRRRAARGEGWLFAHGLEHRHLGFGVMPSLEALDRATAGRPLWLRHRSGHLSWLNSAALRALGCWHEDPPEGRLERGGGRPTGLALEMEGWIAARLRAEADPIPADDLAWASRALLRLGVTAFADLTATNTPENLAAWRAEHAAGRIPQAVRLWLAPGSLSGRVPADAEAAGAVAIGGIKVLLRETGQGLAPGPEALARILGSAARAGWPVAIHAVEGDALALVLEACRRVRARPPGRLPVLRLEHLNLLPPALVEALTETGASVCVQPGLLWALGETYRLTVPREQWPWLFPLAGLAIHAKALGIGSDAPAAPAEPLRHVAAALTRRDRAGGLWNRAERIDPEAALAAITGTAARLAGFDGELGALEPGLRADALWFAVPWGALRRALLRGEPPRPAAAMVGGVWRRWR